MRELSHDCLCCRFPYEQRAALAKNAAGRRLFELMATKRSNLAVAADVATVEEMLALADQARSQYNIEFECMDSNHK